MRLHIILIALFVMGIYAAIIFNPEHSSNLLYNASALISGTRERKHASRIKSTAHMYSCTYTRISANLYIYIYTPSAYMHEQFATFTSKKVLGQKHHLSEGFLVILFRKYLYSWSYSSGSTYIIVHI